MVIMPVSRPFVPDVPIDNPQETAANVWYIGDGVNFEDAGKGNFVGVIHNGQCSVACRNPCLRDKLWTGPRDAAG